MSDLLWAAVIAVDIIVIADILNKLRGTVPRFLWIVAVLALPIAGALVWGYVQYYAPQQKKIEKKARERITKKRKQRKD